MGNSVKSSDLLQLIGKKEFKRLCDKWEMDKGIRRFSTWDQLRVLVNCYLLKIESLREVEEAFGVPRSTMSDANTKRSSGFFEELCELVLKSLRACADVPRKVRGAIGTIVSIDSSTCRIYGGFASEWLWKSRSSQGNKAAVNLHAIWNHNQGWIEDFRLAPVKTPDNSVARKFEIQPHCTYLFDRAYRQLGLWWQVVSSGSNFVTRMIDMSPARRQKKDVLLEQNPGVDGVLYDGPFEPSKTARSQNPEVPKNFNLRHIIYRDPKTKKVFDFITSSRELAAKTIAALYKQRWAVELLFKWMKTHLRIRYIPSRTKNSLRIQLTIAVLIQLLTQLYMLQTNFQKTSWDCLRMLRSQMLKKAINRPLQAYRERKPLLELAIPGW